MVPLKNNNNGNIAAIVTGKNRQQEALMNGDRNEPVSILHFPEILLIDKSHTTYRTFQ